MRAPRFLRAAGLAWALAAVLAAVRVGAQPAPTLQLVEIRPDVTLRQVSPRQALRLTFDRPLDPSTLDGHAIELSYVDSPYTFIVEPFLYTSFQLDPEGGGRILMVDPPEMLPDQTVRMALTADLHGADGSTLAPPPGDTAGRVRRVFTFKVMALPEPSSFVP
jgi:hypothetical protein